MSKELSITLVEIDNQEAPNIGTIVSVTGDETELKEKAIKALESHFDAKVNKIVIQDSLGFEDVRNSSPLDAEVFLEDGLVGNYYKFEIQQTWIY